MIIRRIIGKVSLSLLTALMAYGQQDNVSGLALDSLTVNLHDAINLQRSIELEEIHGVYRLTWWHFAPSPSLNYDFINSRYYVTVSINTSAFVSHMLGKRQEDRRISAANRRYDNQIKSAEIRLRSLLISVNQRISNIQLSYEIVSNDIEIFQIKYSEHSFHEIDTETFLRERSVILNKIRNHNSDVSSIQQQLLDIELLTETVIELDLSEYFFNPSKILGVNDRE